MKDKDNLEFLEEYSNIDIRKNENATSEQMSEFDRRVKEAEVQQREEDVAGIKQDRKQRKDFANKIYWMTVCYLIFVCFVVLFTGCGSLKYDNAVLITFLSTTTINIISLFVIVARYLFPTKRRS